MPWNGNQTTTKLRIAQNYFEDNSVLLNIYIEYDSNPALNNTFAVQILRTQLQTKPQEKFCLQFANNGNSRANVKCKNNSMQNPKKIPKPSIMGAMHF